MSLQYSEITDKSKIKLHRQPYIFSYKEKEDDDIEIVSFDSMDEYYDLITMDRSIVEQVEYTNCRYWMFKTIIDYIFFICSIERKKENLYYIFSLDFELRHSSLGELLINNKQFIKNKYEELLKDKLLTGESMKIIEETVTSESIIRNIKRKSQELYDESIKNFEEWWEDTKKAAADVSIDYETFASIALEEAEDCFENFWFTRLLIGESKIVKLINTDAGLQDCILRDKETGKFVGLVHKELEDDLLRFIEL